MRKLFYAAFCLVLAAFAVSCQSDDDRGSLPEKPTDEFADACKATFSNLADLDVRSGENGNGPRKSFSKLPDSVQTVYVKPNPGLGSPGELQPFTGTTMKDFVDYLEFMDATLSMTNDGTAIDSAKVSVAEAKKSLKPLVSESYKYLKEYGFTTSELKALVADNNTNEEALVLLMMTLKEYDGNASSGLLSPPKPGDKTKPAESTFFKQAVGCALEVIGVNILEDLATGLAENGFKKITKEVVIKIFKKIALRYCGVVGIAFTALQWAHCMNYV